MTTLCIQLGWLAVRVTVFACCAAVLARWGARRAARSAVIVLTAAMLIVLALSVFAFLPAPHFGIWPSMRTASAEEHGERARETASSDEVGGGGISLSMLWTAVAEFSRQAPEAPLWQNVGAVAAVLYALGVIIAGGRLILAWLSVQALRRRSLMVSDANALQLVSELQSRLRCLRPIDLRECEEPGLAATIGSWRPVIFLPPEWRLWSAAELQTVLAHELAHVRHGDYVSGLLTRVCQALHFYHPLVYWLANQLRWQQELAADDLAAAAFVEKDQYVKSLASLALRSPARTPAAAMPYSAIHGGTLLRRIAMLRESSRPRLLHWRLRGLLIAALAGVGLLLSSLGGKATPPQIGVGNAEPFETGYVPSYARGLFAIRPAFLMEQPGMDNAKAKIAQGIRWLAQKGFTVPDELRPENIEQIVGDAGVTRTDKEGDEHPHALILGSSSIYVRLKQEFDWPAYFKKLAREIGAVTNQSEAFQVKEIQDEGVTIYELGVIPMLGPVPVIFSMVDRRSVVFCSLSRDARGPGPAPDPKYLRKLIHNAAEARGRDWGSFREAARAPIAMVWDNHDHYYSKVLTKKVASELFGNIDNIRFSTVVIEVGDGKPVRLIVDAKSEASAAEVEKHVTAAIDKGKRESEKHKPATETEHDKLMRTLGDEWYQSRKVHRQGARIEWLGYSSVRIAHLFETGLGEAKNTSSQTKQPMP